MNGANCKTRCVVLTAYNDLVVVVVVVVVYGIIQTGHIHAPKNKKIKMIYVSIRFRFCIIIE